MLENLPVPAFVHIAVVINQSTHRVPFKCNAIKLHGLFDRVDDLEHPLAIYSDKLP